MTACERKFSEECTEWEGRMRDADRAWQMKMVELEQVWGECGIGKEGEGGHTRMTSELTSPLCTTLLPV